MTTVISGQKERGKEERKGEREQQANRKQRVNPFTITITTIQSKLKKTKGRTEPSLPTSKGTNGETGVPGGKEKYDAVIIRIKPKNYFFKNGEGCSCLESSAKESKRQWVGHEREFHPERSKTHKRLRTLFNWMKQDQNCVVSSN